MKKIRLMFNIIILHSFLLLYSVDIMPFIQASNVTRDKGTSVLSSSVQFTMGSSDTLKLLIVSPVFSDSTYAELSLLKNETFVAAVMQALNSNISVSFSTVVNPKQSTIVVSAYNASTKALIATQTFSSIQVYTPNQKGIKPLSSAVTVEQLNLVFKSSSMSQKVSETIQPLQTFIVIKKQPAPVSSAAPFIQNSPVEFAVGHADILKMLVVSPVFSDGTFAELSLLNNATFVAAVMQALNSHIQVSFSTVVNPAQSTAIVSVYNASTKALIATQTFSNIQVYMPNQKGTKPLRTTVTVKKINLAFQSSSMSSIVSQTISMSQAFIVIKKQAAPQSSTSVAAASAHAIYLTTSDITTLTVVAIGGNLALPSTYFFNTFQAIKADLAQNKEVTITINSTSKVIQTSATTATETLIVGAPYLVIAQDSSGSVQTLVTNDGSFVLSGPVAGKSSTQATIQANQLVLNSKALKGLVVYALDVTQGNDQDTGYAVVPNYFQSTLGNIVSQVSQLTSGQAVQVSLNVDTNLITVTAPNYSGSDNLVAPGSLNLVLASTMNAQNQFSYYLMLLPEEETTVFNISYGAAVPIVQTYE